MKLPSAAQTREWDAFTMAHEPVASIDLMERAAAGCTDLLLRQYGGSPFCVICGTGNNGGDGLAIARMLFHAGALVRVFLAGDPATGSADFLTNYGRLLDMGVNIAVISEAQPWPEIKPREVCVDALLGTGINRPVRGWLARLIRHINASNALIVSIDVPSGFRPDLFELQEGAIIEATETITFQRPLPALLFEEHAAYAGNMTVLDIGLHPGYLGQIETELQYLTQEEADQWIPRRKRFGHKNSFGHVQIMAGSKGKMGAAILSASAAMHAG
ncbi:MAG: NAD(P)H-hydrate epimerase, partial [Bacteroidota bacterium]